MRRKTRSTSDRLRDRRRGTCRDTWLETCLDTAQDTARGSKRVGAFVAAMVAIGVSPAGAWKDVPDLETQVQEYTQKGYPAPIFAVLPPNNFAHNVGLLQLQITNIGIVGNYFIDSFSAGWRGGEYLFGAGLWVGATKSDGIPRVTTAMYETEFAPEPDIEWTVYEAFEGVTNGNRVGFSSGPAEEIRDGIGDIRTSGANDDYNSGADLRIDEDFLNGLDDDLDGLIDEDFEAIGQQMFACQYWDIGQFTAEANPDHVALNLLVQQRSFAWATAGANEFIGLDFSVQNIGNETLNDVFLSFFVDGDCGPKDRANYWLDDKGGFADIDSTVTDDTITNEVCRSRRIEVDVAYMFDTPDVEIDSEEGTLGGDVSGYFGGMFLGHTTDPTGQNAPAQVGIRRARFFSGSEPYPSGDPRNDFERYDLISGEGTPIRDTIRPADYRYVISAGPFRALPPDTALTFQTAFVIGEGRQGMIDNAVQAQLIYNGTWRDADENPFTGTGGRETCLMGTIDGEQITWDSPCDSTSVRVTWEGACFPDNYVDNDCNPCTPLNTGEEDLGLETGVNWVGTVAPPPPVTNTECERVNVTLPEGNRNVLLQWDNLSELKADPIQRRILFEGYRIWRVEGWQRPVGSTGPAPEEWQLLGQIVLNPDSPADICRVPHPKIAGEFVEFEFNAADYLGNWEPDDPLRALPDDPCDACPEFCWPERTFLRDTNLAPIETGIATGDTTLGSEFADRYPIGYYSFLDTAGVKNGMIYFYDITAFSAWEEIVSSDGGEEVIRRFELSGRPAARECQQVVPTWPAQDTKDEVYVVPNPYVQGDRTVLPWGWDLIPSNSDPTGTRIAFANLPTGRNTIKIYSLAGDLVQTLEVTAEGENGTAFWNLVSRNGQDIVAGVYLFTVKTDTGDTKVGRFTVIR